jgi:hypothetical protein
MSLPTIAELRFRPDGVAAVDASLRLSARSYLYCHGYEDGPPIVSLTDEHVSVSLTVPDPDQVTADDVDVARSLAAVVARYIAELKARIAAQAIPVQDDAAARDVAA